MTSVQEDLVSSAILNLFNTAARKECGHSSNAVARTTEVTFRFKMAAYVATHDRSVLAKPYEDTKVSVTQNTTHKDILSKLVFKRG